MQNTFIKLLFLCQKREEKDAQMRLSGCHQMGQAGRLSKIQMQELRQPFLPSDGRPLRVIRVVEIGQQTHGQISALSGYSTRQLSRWFDEYLDACPVWRVKPEEHAKPRHRDREHHLRRRCQHHQGGAQGLSRCHMAALPGSHPALMPHMAYKTSKKRGGEIRSGASSRSPARHIHATACSVVSRCSANDTADMSATLTARPLANRPMPGGSRTRWSGKHTCISEEPCPTCFGSSTTHASQRPLTRPTSGTSRRTYCSIGGCQRRTTATMSNGTSTSGKGTTKPNGTHHVNRMDDAWVF